MKLCVVCDEPFDPINGNQKYCGPTCRKEYNRLSYHGTLPGIYILEDEGKKYVGQSTQLESRIAGHLRKRPNARLLGYAIIEPDLLAHFEQALIVKTKSAINGWNTGGFNPERTC